MTNKNITAQDKDDHFREVTKMIPLTIKDLRRMDGHPVWVDFTGSAVKREPGWFILKNAKECEVYLVGKVSVYKSYEYYGKAWTAYAYPPAYIDLEAWTAEWTVDEFGHKCSKCGEYLVDEEYNTKTKFCHNCGRAMMPEAWAELEKRLRR